MTVLESITEQLSGMDQYSGDEDGSEIIQVRPGNT